MGSSSQQPPAIFQTREACSTYAAAKCDKNVWWHASASANKPSSQPCSEGEQDQRGVAVDVALTRQLREGSRLTVRTSHTTINGGRVVVVRSFPDTSC